MLGELNDRRVLLNAHISLWSRNTLRSRIDNRSDGMGHDYDLSVFYTHVHPSLAPLEASISSDSLADRCSEHDCPVEVYVAEHAFTFNIMRVN